ncbi:MAG: NAD(P)-binding domain-containing protein [Longilinea sp.]|nr:NAD(P)-binding domain-containing protein [Longilinea sp.]
MKIAIIGYGNVGSALAKGWLRAGHEIVFGVREPRAPQLRDLLETLGERARGETVADAAAAAEVVVLATPWSAAEPAIRAAGRLVDKVLVDCTNPIGREGLLAVGHTDSGGECVERWAFGAKVVKAFNCTGWSNMADADYGTEQPRPTMFLCGDEDGAKHIVSQLAEDLGFDAVDCGPLTSARYLEPLAMLWIQLAYRQGLGEDIAFALLRRPQADAEE